MTSQETLVAFFSSSGITKRIVARLADVAKADLFEIVPEIPYTNAYLNWNDANSRSSIEMRDKTSRPAIAAKVSDMNSYDLFFSAFRSGGILLRRLSTRSWSVTISPEKQLFCSRALEEAVSAKLSKISNRVYHPKLL